jgi:hypothetical protein
VPGSTSGAEIREGRGMPMPRMGSGTANLNLNCTNELGKLRWMARSGLIPSGKLENTFLTFLTCYKCKKYSFKKVGAT